MAGFMSSSTAMTIFSMPDCGDFDYDEKLRSKAFDPGLDQDDVRRGWTGFGDMLDTDFSIGIQHGNHIVFSLRVDTRKPSSAAIRLKVAERVLEESQHGTVVVSRARKKEIKEQVTLQIRSRTEFTPSLTDCIIDLDKKRLMIASASSKVLDEVLEFMKATFDNEPPVQLSVENEAGIQSLMVELCRGQNIMEDRWDVHSYGSADLLRLDSEGEKSIVSVKNDPKAIISALDEGLALQKIRIVAQNEEDSTIEYDLVVDRLLQVSALRFPKWEVDKDDPEGTVFLRTEFCARVADLMDLFIRKAS